MTPREILDAIHEGMLESALLRTLGHDATQGRPRRQLLNDALQRLGYGRPITDVGLDRLQPHQSYPDDWIRMIAKAVAGRPNAPLREVIAILERRTVEPTVAD